jgi:hypothetical protein
MGILELLPGNLVFSHKRRTPTRLPERVPRWPPKGGTPLPPRTYLGVLAHTKERRKSMGVLVLLFLMVLAVVILPLLALKLLIRIVFGIVILPLKLAGGAISVTGKVVGLGVRVLASIMGLVFTLLGLVFGVLLLPLLPLLVLAGLVWLVASAFRPRSALVRL